MDVDKEKEIGKSTEDAPIKGSGNEIPEGFKEDIKFSGAFSALRHRNYRLFFTGQTISITGTWMQNVAQSWLVYALTSSPLYLGIVNFAASIPTLLLSPSAGVIADRVPKRMMLVMTQISSMLLAFVLATDVFIGTVRPWHIVVLSFLFGAVNSFDAPTRQAFVVEMVERKDMANAIALNAVIFNTGRVIGPTLAGIGLALLGPGWCFSINGLSFIPVILGLMMMKVKPYVGAGTKDSTLKQFKEGLSYIRHNKTILTLLMLVAVSNLFAFSYATLLPAFAKDVLHKGPSGLGLMSASSGFGALVGALMVAWFGHSKRRGMILTFGNLFFPLMIILFAMSRNFYISCLLLVAVGWGFMLQNTTINTLIQTIVPDELRGRVMSIYTLFFLGLFPLGSLMAGAVAEHVSIPAGAEFGAVIALAFGLFLFWRAPYLRKLA